LEIGNDFARAFSIMIQQYDFGSEAPHSSREGAGRSDRADADNSDLRNFTFS